MSTTSRCDVYYTCKWFSEWNISEQVRYIQPVKTKMSSLDVGSMNHVFKLLLLECVPFTEKHNASKTNKGSRESHTYYSLLKWISFTETLNAGKARGAGRESCMYIPYFQSIFLLQKSLRAVRRVESVVNHTLSIRFCYSASASFSFLICNYSLFNSNHKLYRAPAERFLIPLFKNNPQPLS